MEEIEYKLNLSCETFALLKPQYFISSFPSYIVFGKPFTNRKYEEKQSFQIHFSEAYKILVNLLYIGSFLSSDIEFTKGSILERGNVNYLWCGNINEQSEKVVTFSIETNEIKTFEVTFSVPELNNFIYLFNRCLLSCLCLKDLEEEFILYIIQNSCCQRILLSKTDKNIASELVNQFVTISNLTLPSNTSTLREILRYYNDLILILKQLEAIHVPEESQSALILVDN